MGIYTGVIRELHFEPTSNCNARCPLCPRTFHQTLETHPKLKIESWLPEELDQVLQDSLFGSLQSVTINGNFGDIVIHPNPKNLIQCFINRNLRIKIHTNGGAQDKSFWSWLGSVSKNIRVDFGIDGLEDTHHLYRRNTRFSTVIQNAKTFIEAGGTARWIMTVFENNKHQVDSCKKIAKNLGFSKFQTRMSNRHNGYLSILDKNFNHSYFLKDGDSQEVLSISKEDCEKGLINFSNVFPIRDKSQNKTTKINCYVEKDSSIFLSYEKRLWPCCWTAAAFENEKMLVEAEDITDIYKKELKKDFEFNNVLRYTPTDIYTKIKSFEKIEKTWNSRKPCATCQNTCGV